MHGSHFLTSIAGRRMLEITHKISSSFLFTPRNENGSIFLDGVNNRAPFHTYLDRQIQYNAPLKNGFFLID